ncbi:hypothetical protein SKAU_G00141870 [Synaphobranchus kaupii]|uniref:Uncharacterized protein n=1 Tax=Synaphobranchus kaupii TaxID=118154 RepID=A0A9Q1FT00_SYNKA|nr:hypothetical protein SKAU_G00141870 [Synaphobranchus kaupii]
MGEQLTLERQDLQDLVNRNRDVFSTEAGHTDLIQHQIVTEPGLELPMGTRTHCRGETPWVPGPPRPPGRS